MYNIYVQGSKIPQTIDEHNEATFYRPHPNGADSDSDDGAGGSDKVCILYNASLYVDSSYAFM